MDPPNLLISAEVIPWPWWLLIGLAVGYFLLLVWSLLTKAKQADEEIYRQVWLQQKNRRR